MEQSSSEVKILEQCNEDTCSDQVSKSSKDQEPDNAQTKLNKSNEEDLIFKFDIVEKNESISCSATESRLEHKPSLESQDSILSDLKSLLEIDEIEKEIERKAEERKKTLMSLLDENKSVLQKMKVKELSHSNTIEEVSWKTETQLRSMEELR